MPEIWKEIAGYEGYYEVSNEGRVRSMRRVLTATSRKGLVYERVHQSVVLIPGRRPSGHLGVTLWKAHESTQPSIHSLVLEAFVSPRPAGLYGCHIDGVPSNNRVENLYWGTAKENAADKIRHGTQQFGEQIPWSKLREPEVREIREMRGLIPQAELANRFGIRQSHVSRIQLGRAWGRVQ